MGVDLNENKYDKIQKKSRKKLKYVFGYVFLGTGYYTNKQTKNKKITMTC